jgi:2-oxo-3-hexenedioate decarboxylase/2-keto-4-pentenoate hydratase
MSIAAAAAALARHRAGLIPLPALPPAVRPGGPEEAYDVQDVVHGDLEALLGRRVGYKIGCTTPVMQAYLGIPSPCSGGLFAGTTHGDGAVLDPGAFVRVGIECEIAVRLARDLGASVAVADMHRAIGSYMPAIEIVDDRYEDWRTIGTPTLIADDFFAAGCVLGRPVNPPDVGDLGSAIGRTLVNGVEVGRGTGADVMGHPHAALVWLAGHLEKRGKMLREGEIVLTGSLVQTVWLHRGDKATVSISGLGEVRLELLP